MLGEEQRLMQNLGLETLGYLGNNHGYVLISGDKKGEVKIWCDGGSAISCCESHVSSVRELRIYGSQVII